MDDAGFQEVHFPALLPKEPYESTNRWEEYGPDLFRLKDRKGNDYLLGPTHEEMFTLMVKGEFSSYKIYHYLFIRFKLSTGMNHGQEVELLEDVSLL
jgi:seryl-tRNA synthetase